MTATSTISSPRRRGRRSGGVCDLARPLPLPDSTAAIPGGYNVAVQNAFRLALVVLTLGETLIAHWVMLVAGFGGLSWEAAAVTAAGVAAFNGVAFPAARRRIRAEGTPLILSRSWIIGSIAALWAGLLLAAAFAALHLGLFVASLATDVAPATRIAALALGGGLALAVGFGSIGWGYLVGGRKLAVENIRLPLEGLRRTERPLRVAQITDLHIGRLLRGPQLRSFVDRINTLDADLVAITGDIFDFDPAYIEEGCAELARLRARHGVFAVLGNHDVYTGADAVADALARHTPVRVLRDEWVTLDIDGASLCLAGVEDTGVGWTEKESESVALARLAERLPAELPRLLLIHRPSYFRQAARLGFGVILAGHTHAGQLRLPFLPNHNASRVIAHWTAGRFEIGSSHLYVSRGIGMAGLPVRLNCPREISLIELAPSA